MVLKQIDGTSPTQSTLGNSMGTNSSVGTYVYKITNELNNRQSKFTYAHQLISTQTAMKNALYASIGYNAPAILHARTKSLVMYNGTDLGHYLVAETVVEKNVDGVLDEVGYVDPWYKDYGKGSVFGKHFDSASNIF